MITAHTHRVLTSPHSTQKFRVYRSLGAFEAGGWKEHTPSPEYFEVPGIVVPTSIKDIDMLPEGDRIRGVMSFYSKVELFTTRAGQTPGTSDRLMWRGEMYRILQITQHKDWGVFKSIGTREAGD